MSSPVYSRSVPPTESDSPPRPLSVVELSLDSIFVILSSSVSADDHTIKYVVGSEPIRRDCLQLKISMAVDDAYILQWCACGSP